MHGRTINDRPWDRLSKGSSKIGGCDDSAVQVEDRSPIRFARVEGSRHRLPDLGRGTDPGGDRPALGPEHRACLGAPGVPRLLRPPRPFRPRAALRQAGHRGVGPHRPHAHHRRARRGPRRRHGCCRVRPGPPPRPLRGRAGDARPRRHVPGASRDAHAVRVRRPHHRATTTRRTAPGASPASATSTRRGAPTNRSPSTPSARASPAIRPTGPGSLATSGSRPRRPRSASCST